MFEEFLPQIIADSLDFVEPKYLQELRIRALKPVTICYSSEFYYLGKNGIVNKKAEAIIINIEWLKNW